MEKTKFSFGIFNSESQEQEIQIPNGYEASIEDGKIIFRKLESEDEKIKKKMVEYFKSYKEHTHGFETFNGIPTDNILAWIEKQSESVKSCWKPSKEQLEAFNYFVRSIGESGYASPYDNNTKLLYSLLHDLEQLEKQGEKPQGKTALEAINEEVVDNQNCVNSDNNIEQLQIKRGNWYVCIKDYQFCEHDYPTFEKGKIYKSVKDEEIIAEDGGKWPFGDAKDYFRIASQEEINSMIKSANKINPKFKDGEWVTNKLGDAWHIDSFDNKNYQVSDGKGKYNYFPISKQDEMHIWSIEDAKDSDILAVEPIEGYSFPFIGIYKERGLDFFNSYCFISFDGKFHESAIGHSIENIHPATKEQRNLLFSKMGKAGYEWDDEKKKLEKIEQKQTLRERYENIAKSEWFKRTHEGMSVGDEESEEAFCDVEQKIFDDLLNNGEQMWSEDDEKNLQGIIDEIEANKNEAPDYDVKTYNKFLKWLKSLKQRLNK